MKNTRYILCFFLIITSFVVGCNPKKTPNLKIIDSTSKDSNFEEKKYEWKKSIFNGGIYYNNNVVVGNDTKSKSPLLVINDNPKIGRSLNTNISIFRRILDDSQVDFNIYGYPDTDLVFPHLRKSIMLYSTGDATDLILCAAPRNGSIRFITDDWVSPEAERARITSRGLGIGTIHPKEKLHISDGEIYLEDINSGVIMKSPNGKCWRMTVSDEGQPVFNSINCPE